MTLLALSLFTPAHAQELDAEPAGQTQQVKYKQRTEIEFGELDVSAGVLKPSLTPAFEIRQGKFNPMIELRKSFDPEMQRSIDAVK